MLVHVLLPVFVDPHGRQNMVVSELDPVEVDNQHVDLAEVSLSQLPRAAKFLTRPAP